MKRPWSSAVCSVVLLVIGSGAMCWADTTTWNGNVDSDWFIDGNWDNGHPVAGDDAVINAGADVLLTNATELLSSLTMGGGTLTFSNWYTCVNATNVVLNGGTVTLPNDFAELQMSNRVWFVCSNDFTLGAAATIDANAKGFVDKNGPGQGSATGGGGYGGHGGTRGGNGGVPYGSTNAPLAPGSGGGFGSANAAGSGGGAVRIHAGGTATVNGTIAANGGGATHTAGGGSGGAVYITCDTFGGSTNGLISVVGGDGKLWSGPYYLGSAGGGGRIAVDYNNLDTTHGARFRATQGTGNRHVDWNYNAFPVAAQMGTLWLPDTALLSGTLQGELFKDVVLYIPGFTSWDLDALTVSNCWVTFGYEGFVLTVTNDLRIDDGSLGLHGDVITRTGDLILTNGAGLYIYANPTNSPTPGYGARVSITGDVRIADSSWIYPIAEEDNGATVFFEMNGVTIAAGGGINADGRGYRSAAGPGAAGIANRGGAGHGGVGNEDGGKVGPEYDSTNAPVQPGSGGGLDVYGGFGGGAVRIVAAGSVTVNGTISANGLGNLSTGAGCGSGGAIDIDCATFGGSGSFSAVGGSGTSEYAAWWYGGAGGGGRIAVHYANLAASRNVKFVASGGEGTERKNPHRLLLAAGDGTVWLPDQDLLSNVLTDNLFTDVRLFSPGFSSWNVDSLTVSNCSLTFGEEGFALTVTNDLQVGANGVLGVRGDIVVSQGNLALADGGNLYMYAGATNGAPGDNGAQVNVAGDMTIGVGSWVYPQSDDKAGGCVQFLMRNLTVATNAGFDADGRGYASGYGPGGGGTGPGTGSGGAGYGGRGGNYGGVSGGAPYAFTNAPLAPGSAGGMANAGAWWQSGCGGGLVWIEASGTVIMDGTVTVDGRKAGGTSSGAGAGGGMLISCAAFSGGADARLAAEGKDGPWHSPSSAWYGGGGGGGRIAVWQGITPSVGSSLIDGQPLPANVIVTNGPVDTYAGAISVTNGIGWGYANDPPNAAQPGSVAFLIMPPPRGTLILIR